ncbi:MAG: type II secretion system F family protein [Phycisphaerales bacterium]|nr:MAG: type II secretion system F family protein [Phycisphaerales bacterium]
MLIIASTLLATVGYIIVGLKRPGIALVTAPFVAGALVVMAAAEEDVVAVSVAPLVFAATLIAVLLTKREPDAEQWPQACAKWILILLTCLLALVTMVVVFGPLGMIGFFFVILFFGSIIAYGLTSRHATAAHVISTIGSSMRQNLPLPMALESAASGISNGRSRALRGIKKWLVQGYSLSESVKRGYPKCPGYALAMIAATERIDQLPYAIKAIEDDMMAKADERQRIRPVHPLYPVILMTFTFLMLLGVMTFIIPQFKTVLEEMTGGDTLPAATRSLLAVMEFAVHDYAWLVWLILALLVLMIIPASIYVRFRPRRPEKPFLISRIGDSIKWHLPILHRFEKDYSMVQVVELLRLSLKAGCPINEAIRNALGLDVNNCFKKRMRRWLEHVERGDNVSSAARQNRLGSPLAWAFDEKVNQGNTLSILETLESFYRSNYAYCVNLARFILWPCVTLVMGAIVGFVVLAIFLPGISIITQLTGQVNP